MVFTHHYYKSTVGTVYSLEKESVDIHSNLLHFQQLETFEFLFIPNVKIHFTAKLCFPL